jgi:hypothetical protein
VRGIVRTVIQLVWFGGLQRVLFVIGGVLTLISALGLAASSDKGVAPLFALAGLLGTVALVAAPILLDGMLFRSLSAPRAVGLIPNGRLQLILGALLTQALLALLITASVSELYLFNGMLTPAMSAAIWVTAFGALSSVFLLFYYASVFRLGAFVVIGCILAVQLLFRVFPLLHARDLFGAASGISCLFGASLVAWLVFGVQHLRARHIGAPFQGNISVEERNFWYGLWLTAPRTARRTSRFDRRNAMRMLLRGPLRAIPSVSSAVVCAVLFGIIFFSGDHGRPNWHFLANFMFALAGPPVGLAAYPMLRRAKSLWLNAALDRTELFRLVEAQSWRLALTIMGVALALAAIAALFHPPSVVTLGWTLLALPVGNAAMIYTTLLYARGRRLLDLLIVGTVTLLWLVEFIVSRTDIDGSVMAPLLGAQLLLAPVLRAVAQRRWRSIDWLINRPQPVAARPPVGRSYVGELVGRR